MATTEMIFPRSERPSRLVQWKVREGTTVATGRVLFAYKNLSPDGSGTTGSEKKFRATQFGTIVKLLLKDNDRIQPGDPVIVVEGCRHPTIMKDLCAECGVDLREEGAAGEKPLPTRAIVPMVHSIPELKVTPELAEKIGKADVERLLKDKKLALLVDLDQTIVHTTNDNVPAVMKDVYHYQLYGSRSPWYHTRLRPNTRHFLEEMSKYYELHICTFGARMYAHKVAKILDTEGQLFSHRILSRDECFDPLSKTANLKALFPCGDDMVCIIDDREDVWQGCGNLVQVKPYHFFRNTGDIHAPMGFGKNEESTPPISLPDIDEPEQTETTENGEATQSDEQKNTDDSGTKYQESKETLALDVEMNLKSDLTTEQTNKEEDKSEECKESSEEKCKEKLEEKSEEVKESSVEKCKEKLEEKSEEVKESSVEKCKEKLEEKSEEVKDVEEKEKSHENKDNKDKDGSLKETEVVYEDNDDYLLYLEDILKRIHIEFYRDFDIEKNRKSLSEVIPKVREKVLEGLHLTFSGLVPTHQKLEQSRAYRVARAFGAHVYQDLVAETTHLVAIRPGTVKVNAARKNEKIKIVNPEWLWTCAERWEHVDERLFPLTIKVRGSRIPPPHCSSPERIENTESTEKARSVAKNERFADSINPLLTFSREEIDNMDKEVDEDMDDLELDDAFDAEEKSDSESSASDTNADVEGNDKKSESDNDKDEENENNEESRKRSLSDSEEEYLPKLKKKRSEDSSSEDTDEDLVVRFRRGQDLPDDLDLGDPNSQASIDDQDNDDLEDDREWNAMGEALEREFLSE